MEAVQVLNFGLCMAVFTLIGWWAGRYVGRQEGFRAGVLGWEGTPVAVCPPGLTRQEQLLWADRLKRAFKGRLKIDVKGLRKFRCVETYCENWTEEWLCQSCFDTRAADDEFAFGSRQ